MSRRLHSLSQALLAITFALAAAACPGGPKKGQRLEAELGGLTVIVQASPPRLVVQTPDGRVLWDGLAGGEVTEGQAPLVALAFRRARAQYIMQFGSFNIDEVEADPWQGVTRFAELAQPDDQTVTFTLVGPGEVTLGQATIAAAGGTTDGHLSISFTATNPAHNRISAGFACAQREHFLGLGGQSYDVDHRGHSVPIWVEEDGITKHIDDTQPTLWPLQGRYHSTHSPMPIYLSSRGYALMLESDNRSIFHLCSEATDAGRVEAWEGEMRLRLFYAGEGDAGTGGTPNPSGAITKLTAHLGRPDLPPPFAFAPWLDALYGSANVRRVAQLLRDEGVPCSAIWSEDWRGGDWDGQGYTLDEDWQVDRGLYPDFEAVADDLHGLGFKWLTYNNTFISQHVDIWDEALAERYTIQTRSGTTFTFTSAKFEPASLLDLTNPDAWEWGKAIYRTGLDLGADGYMADFCEWMPTNAVLANGDATSYHNRYPVDCQRIHRELFDELYAEDGIERLFFVRSAYLGSQPLVSVFWAGDQQTDFTPGDGLPSVIPIGLGVGVTGFPYYGHDVGGYMSQQTDPTTKELWFRWVTLGALSPVMRTHHGKSADENWNIESDPSSIAHFRRWGSFHLRLFPYLYGLAESASATDGLPMMRTLALEHPDWDPAWSLTDQYYLGDRLLVAPIVEADATSREVRLPAGTWYALTDATALAPSTAVALTIGDTDGEGGGATTADASWDEIPVFVPAGTLLVLLPAGVNTLVADSLVSMDASTVVTLADAGDDRELWLYPGDSSASGAGGWTEAGGVLSYAWNGASLSGPVTAVTWNGSPVTVDGDHVTVTGSGTLTVNGSATLDITGGAANRVLLIRFR